MLLEILSVLDWISPFQAMTSGGQPISIRWSSGTPAYYETILIQSGIEVVGRVVVRSDGFVIVVAPEDVDRARQILALAGADLA